MRTLLRVAVPVALSLPAWAACAFALYVAVLLGLSQDPASPVVLVTVVTLLSAGSAIAFLMLALSVITGRPLLPLPRMRRLWARAVYGTTGLVYLGTVALITPLGFAEAVITVNLDGPADVRASEREWRMSLHAAVVELDPFRRIASVEVRAPSGKIVLLTPSGDNHPLWPVAMWTSKEAGLPEKGNYVFIGRDADGEPLPGIRKSTEWRGSQPPDPPTNLRAELRKDGLLISWDEVPPVPGFFDPSAGAGYYRLAVSRQGGPGSMYYAELTGSTWHVQRTGFPGLSHWGAGGHALEKWPDGQYTISVTAFALWPKGNQWNAWRYENKWIVVDSKESIPFTIRDGMMVIVLDGKEVPQVWPAPTPTPANTPVPLR